MLSQTFLCLQDYKAEYDPKTYHSEKTGRGPLGGNWIVCTTCHLPKFIYLLK